MPIPQGENDILTEAATRQVAQALSGVSEFCVDVEADSMHHFHARLCFVQVGTDTDIFLLDTLLPEVKADALSAPLGDPSKTKFFHAAQGDLTYLAEAGVRVKGLFDTHRAATLLGWPKVGLGDLVLEKLGTQLKKEHQQSDFSLRPLPPEMRAYIADDVRYLTELGRMVQQACREADIFEEVMLDCDRMCEEAAERPDLTQDYRIKLPRQGLSGQQARVAEAAAQALHRLRLTLGEAADLPMGRVLSNAAIGAIATSMPTTVKDLGRLQGVRGAFAREHGEQVLAALRDLEGQAQRGELPESKEKKRDPQRKKREDALTDWRKGEATRRKVTPSAVLPNALVADIAQAAPRSADELAQLRWLGEKRLERYAEALLSTLRPYL